VGAVGLRCLLFWELLFEDLRGSDMGHVLDWQGLEESGEITFDRGAVPVSVISLGWPITSVSLMPAED
jgi:hypothetical protein